MPHCPSGFASIRTENTLPPFLRTLRLGIFSTTIFGSYESLSAAYATPPRNAPTPLLLLSTRARVQPVHQLSLFVGDFVALFGVPGRRDIPDRSQFPPWFDTGPFFAIPEHPPRMLSSPLSRGDPLASPPLFSRPCAWWSTVLKATFEKSTIRLEELFRAPSQVKKPAESPPHHHCHTSKLQL